MPSTVVHDISLYEGVYINGVCSIATGVLLLYEYALTLPQEFETVWRRKWNATSLLLLLIRWTMVLLGVCSFLQPIQKSLVSPRCNIRIWILTIVRIICWAEIDFFIAFRLSAIWGHNRLLFAAIFVLGLAPVITNTISASISLPAYSPHLPGCFYKLRIAIPPSNFERSWKMYLCHEKYTHTTRCHRAGSHMGTGYFFVLFALNVAQIAVFNSQHALLTQFLQAIPLILASRFMMNLRQLGNRADWDTEAQPWTNYSTVVFNPNASYTLGNIGQYLDLGDELERDVPREWYELEDFAPDPDRSRTIDIGFSSTGAVYEYGNEPGPSIRGLHFVWLARPDPRYPFLVVLQHYAFSVFRLRRRRFVASTRTTGLPMSGRRRQYQSGASEAACLRK
ncbi:hypothetical protein PsYK624_014380 [Phanerochaete sordida]|uniref:DUF6533 domain-containing protein n=1 Tax=Phanerochaete sordida TaxID=48140 RepID=A0A9P3L8C1_9APHY|nr:hypothetical protein PsYK624_014380 [Phanerochaete sordida]